MASKKLETRVAQKEALEKRIVSRIAQLREKGTNDLEKDPILRSLKADLRDLNKRLEAIAAIKETYEKVKAQKEQKALLKKQSQKVEEEDVGPSKRKQKKESKKQERVKKAIEKKQTTGQA